MKKRDVIIITIVLVFFGGIIGWNLFKGFMMKRYFAHYTPNPVTISSVKAKNVAWVPEIDSVGSITAINGVEVNSESSGNVVAIHFNSGQYIQKDKALIQIDDSVEQATLKYQQAELTLKQLSFKRQSDLYKKGASPVSNVDEANANLQQALANVEKIQTEIAQKNITAPFSGRLGIRQINLGEFISPGQTKIVTLQSLDPLYIMFYLPEQFYDSIRLGQKVYYTVEQYPHLIFEAKITALNSKIDTKTHNLQIQATTANCPLSSLQNPEKSNLIKWRPEPNGSKKIITCDSQDNEAQSIRDFSFIPGMFASVRVVKPTEKQTIILPSTAISFTLYGDSVFILKKDPKGTKDKNGHDLYQVKRTFVRTGDIRGNYTVILSGVKEGDTVVSAGDIKLNDNATVIINNDIKLKDFKNPDALGQ